MRRGLDRFFGLTDRGTTLATELVAGATTFMTMSYIVVVNPQILGAAGLPVEETTLATCVASGLATLLMGLLANYPVALAPGMGINAFFTYSVVRGMGVDPHTALGCVLASGLIFLLLTFVRGREAILNAIPAGLKHATAAGIGLFIALIGLQHAGLVRANPDTMLALGDIRAPQALLALGGLTLSAVLAARRVPGAILVGILVTTAASIVFGVSSAPRAWVSLPVWPEGFGRSALRLPDALLIGGGTVVFSFLFVGVFDTVGSLVGVARAANLVGSDGKLPRAGRALASDAVGTTVGALLGTSTVVAYIESASGVTAGGRTGLCAVTTAVLLFAAALLGPLAAAVPPHATAPALILVGALMMAAVAEVAWGDVTEAVPAFLTVATIPLTYSIATGLALGFVAWPLLKAATGRGREVHPLIWTLAALFVARYAFLPAH